MDDTLFKHAYAIHRTLFLLRIYVRCYPEQAVDADPIPAILHDRRSRDD